MSSFLKSIQQPLGVILPLDEVKRRVIVDALDKCGGNYRLTAHLLGIGKSTVYRMARQYSYQQPQMQGNSLSIVSQHESSRGMAQDKRIPIQTVEVCPKRGDAKNVM